MTTPVQQQVQAVLGELKVRTKSGGTTGSPAEYEVTQETLDFLQNKVVLVKSDGSVEPREASRR